MKLIIKLHNGISVHLHTVFEKKKWKENVFINIHHSIQLLLHRNAPQHIRKQIVFLYL